LHPFLELERGWGVDLIRRIVPPEKTGRFEIFTVFHEYQRNFMTRGKTDSTPDDLEKLLADLPPELRELARSKILQARELVRVGVALSAEKNLENLLELIVREAMDFSGSDGGTLYLTDTDGRSLRFAIVQNHSLKLRMGGTGSAITWPPIALRDGTDRANDKNVCAYCANTKKVINIADVYDAEGFDFEGTRRFDGRTGYRSRSMLLVPMMDHEDEVVGVLQLLNGPSDDDGSASAFPEAVIDTIRSLASQAAVAVNNVRLLDDLRDLLESFIKAIATAIDRKSPYTGGHIRRVTELSLQIAETISDARTGAFRDKRFTSDELAELRYAAWMHDIGKITTPEYVVDKATRLETVCDRIEMVRLRMEVMKKDFENRIFRETLKKSGKDPDALLREAGRDEELDRLDAAFGFLEEVNRGGEYLSDAKIEQIREIAEHPVGLSTGDSPVLTEEEARNLSLRRGTLNEEERRVVNEHVETTGRLLESLPFPAKLRNVPSIAAAHHEKLDGSGYPRGLGGEELSLSARILAVADVFEALTAADRPYKRANRLSDAARILSRMVRANELDGDVCEALMNGGVARRYGEENLNPKQLDSYTWPLEDEE